MTGTPQPLPAALTRVAGERTLIMGVVNVTDNSFSDGGQFEDAAGAIAQGRRLIAQGADIIDVGGEATGPGTSRTAPEVELARVLPVISALAADGIVCSIDTMRAQVARAAVEAGALIVNDVSGGLADDAMAPTVAELGTVFIAMHWRTLASGFAQSATYDDVVADVRSELGFAISRAVEAGVRPEQIVADPGLGFSKEAEHNWPLLTDFSWAQGYPVLIGASRKRFLGAVLARDGVAPPPLDRDDATAAISALAARAGAWCVRVHEVPSTYDAVRVGAAWRAAELQGEVR